MPNYSKATVNRRITNEDCIAILKQCSGLRDMGLISLMYILPLRPAEITHINPSDFRVEETEGKKIIHLRVITKKLPVGKYFAPRNFKIRVKTPISEILFKCFKQCGEYRKPFDISIRRIQQIVQDASIKGIGVYLCPYSFRHNALTREAENGASPQKLMYLKGSNDIKSVTPYIRGKIQEIEI